MKFLSAAVMREVDRRSIQEAGIAGGLLMERAGRGVAEAVLRWARAAGRMGCAVRLLAGRGNNGGDAFAAAVFLQQWGFHPEVWLAGRTADVQGDAAIHLQKLSAARIPLQEMDTERHWQIAAEEPYSPPVVVDGLLGTGSQGAPRGVLRLAVEYCLARAAQSFIVAIDLPSGLDADSGVPAVPTVRADLTVTLAAPKPGLAAPAAIEFVGGLEVVDIGVPQVVLQEAPAALPELELITREEVLKLLPRRQHAAHKGDFGRILLIGGSAGYAGAIVMAARAALRSGVGLTHVLAPRSLVPGLAPQAPEAMFRGGDETALGSLRLGNEVEFREWLFSFNAVLIGPGLSCCDASRDLVEFLLRECPCPLVLDADAITVWAGRAGELARCPVPVVLTPHPGEMGRLLGCASQAVQQDRLACVKAAATQTQAVVVLKGAGTLVAQAGKPVQLNATGNPGMATGGSGDVLAGLLAGLLGQRLEPYDAARLAVFLHGLAGDQAAWRHTQQALKALDLVEELPGAFREVLAR